jgi:hypothetical protein
VQRSGAAHEAQSGWTTAKQTTKWRGGGRQPFLEQKLRKKRESAIFLVVPWHRPKKNFLNTFLTGYNFYSFFVFNFLDSWNLIMDKFYNRQNNKSYCFFFGVILAKALFFKFLSRTVRSIWYPQTWLLKYSTQFPVLSIWCNVTTTKKLKQPLNNPFEAIKCPFSEPKPVHYPYCRRGGCFKEIKMRLGPRCSPLLVIISWVPAKRVQNPKITANLDIWVEIFRAVIFLFEGCPPGVPF